jgi:hypothetical protein
MGNVILKNYLIPNGEIDTNADMTSEIDLMKERLLAVVELELGVEPTMVVVCDRKRRCVNLGFCLAGPADRVNDLMNPSEA